MTGTHRVPGGHFDELARGGGGAPVVQMLRRGQLSKRLLQLRAILDESGSAGVPVADACAAETAFTVLSDLNRKAPGAVGKVLQHPQVGAWASRCLALLRAPHGSPAGSVGAVRACLGHLGAVTASAALIAGEDAEVVVPVRAGRVMLPMIGQGRLESRRDAVARLTVRDRAVTVVCDGETVRLMPGGAAGQRVWEPLRRLHVSTDGQELAVFLDDLDPFRDFPGLALAGRLDAGAVANWRAVLQEAWALLVRHHADAAQALSAGLVSLVPLADAGVERGVSATSVDAFGATALSPPVVPSALAVALVHEFQHSKLSALLDMVPLYDRGRQVLLYAPWRDDPRPIGGLLQGAYAYVGVTAFWRAQRHVADEREATFAHFEFARWREQSARAVDVLAGSGALTPAGERFVTGMGAALAGWQAEPVPPDPVAAARDAATDHWLAWRVRNLVPDDEQVRAAAADWLARRPSRHPFQPRATPLPGRFAPVPNGRLSLLHLRLRDPRRYAEVIGDADALSAAYPHTSPADAAYVDGRYDAAAAAYRTALQADPDSPHAWAGLALARYHQGAASGAEVMMEHPDFVRALCREVARHGAPSPDPEVLAQWLASPDGSPPG
jgi:HEXXH motif-containing protein